MKKAKPITFSARLTQLLEEADITAYRLAKTADMAHQTVNHFIRGDRKPSLANALRIARALGKSLAVFDDIDLE